MRKQKSDSQAKENKRTNAINKDGGDDKTQYCQRHKDACGGIQTEKNKQTKKSLRDGFFRSYETLKYVEAPAGESESVTDVAGSIVISAAASKKVNISIKK